MIAVLDYGIGNIRSAEKAIDRAGGDARLVTSPEEVERASAVVLPGVGAFGRCAEALRATGLDEAALAAIGRGVPFLGICIGFQLLYDASEEAPGVPGLGVLDGTVRALPAGEKSPQMQWNQLVRTGLLSGMLAGLGQAPWVYFVHSYAPELPTPMLGSPVVATCDYGGPVVAAVERDHVWGTQFHPEKSGKVGLAVLANFVALSRRAGVRR